MTKITLLLLGKRGMNARLNGALAGVELQVQKMSQYQTAMSIERAQIAQSEDPTLDSPSPLKELVA